jgi:hypothetical protein
MALAWLRSPAVAATLAIAGLPFAAGAGCAGRSACFTYTQGEYTLNGNSCPSVSDALASFSDPKCPGPVSAVDGPGSFDGQICCYPVTYDDVVPDCGNSGLSGQGGGFTAPPPPPMVGVGGSVGGGSTGSCQPLCNEFLLTGLTVCGGGIAAMELQALVSCAMATCAPNCGLFIGGCQALDSTCEGCLQITCSTELSACQSG